jgi:hypothetical protein
MKFYGEIIKWKMKNEKFKFKIDKTDFKKHK